jgi:hypothetical protein
LFKDLVEYSVEYEKKCLDCQADMSRIVYGYPYPALMEIKEEKGWTLGGCIHSDIEFICKSCNSIWSSVDGFIKP